VNAPVVDAAGAVAGYERLRSSVSGERVEEPGLGLLMRRGLRAWLETRVVAAASTPTSATSADVHELAATGTRAELARLIAAMVIGAATTEARP
jgi:hypothetical protein